MNKNQKRLIASYTLLLLAGGFIGYMKSGSHASLIMASSFCAILLALLVFSKKIKNVIVITSCVLLALDLVFSYRFLKSYKFVPAGAFAILTFIVLVLFLKFSDQTRKKARREP